MPQLPSLQTGVLIVLVLLLTYVLVGSLYFNNATPGGKALKTVIGGSGSSMAWIASSPTLSAPMKLLGGNMMAAAVAKRSYSELKQLGQHARLMNHQTKIRARKRREATSLMESILKDYLRDLKRAKAAAIKEGYNRAQNQAQKQEQKQAQKQEQKQANLFSKIVTGVGTLLAGATGVMAVKTYRLAGMKTPQEKAQAAFDRVRDGTATVADAKIVNAIVENERQAAMKEARRLDHQRSKPIAQKNALEDYLRRRPNLQYTDPEDYNMKTGRLDKLGAQIQDLTTEIDKLDNQVAMLNRQQEALQKTIGKNLYLEKTEVERAYTIRKFAEAIHSDPTVGSQLEEEQAYGSAAEHEAKPQPGEPSAEPAEGPVGEPAAEITGEPTMEFEPV